MLAPTTSMFLPAPQPAVGAMELSPGTAALPGASDEAEALRLTTAVSRGDETAFRILYEQYNQRLFRLALVAARGDEALARDAVQATMLTAAAKLKPLKTREHLWNWLACVARQHLAKAWRQHQREPAMTPLAEDAEIQTLEPDLALEEGLDAALHTLDREDLQTVEWFYFEGLTHKEIAERQDSSSKAVSSRLERIRLKLRAFIRKKLSHET